MMALAYSLSEKASSYLFALYCAGYNTFSFLPVSRATIANVPGIY
jgi:hypothetical protein